MSDRRLGVGVVGCGARGQRLMERVQGAGERATVTALYDPDPQAAERARSAQAPDAAICSEHEAVAARDDVDLVIVSSPDHAHRDPVVAAFAHGKHVFCEKPMATTVQDCLDIWQAAQRADRALMVGFVLRFSPFYEEIKRRIDAGDLGRLMTIEANENLSYQQGAFFHRDWRRFREFTGTYLLEKCCHDLDILSWFTGALPVRVASFGGRSFFTPRADAPLYCRDCDLDCAHRLTLDPLPPKPAEEPRLTRGRHIDLCAFNSSKDIVDHQVAIIEYANGVRCTFHSNQNAGKPSRRMYVVGERGCIEGDLYWGHLQYAPVRHMPTDRFEGSEWQRIEVGHTGQHGGGDLFQMERSLATLLDGGELRAGGRQGLVACVTALAIDEARETGTVVDLTDTWERFEIDAV